MSVVTFVLSDEMADVTIAGLQWFILIPRLNYTGSHRPIDSHSIPYLHQVKYRIWNKNYPACCNPTNYGESSRSSLILVASYNIPQRKAEVLFYTIKPGPHGEINVLYSLFASIRCPTCSSALSPYLSCLLRLFSVATWQDFHK